MENNLQLKKLQEIAERKWSWYEKEFFEEGELTVKKRLAIIATMMDFALKQLTDNIIETISELDDKQNDG